MGVFDDLKDSVSGSDKAGSKNSGNMRNNTSSSNDVRDGFSSDFGSNDLQDNIGSQNTGNAQNQGGSGRNFPNPQAGRPQEGSDSPQLSSNTRKKMENAGMNPNSQGRGQQNSNRKKCAKQSRN